MKAIERVFEQIPDEPLYTKPQPTSQYLIDAVRAEREVCAKICLELSAEFNDPYPLVRASDCILARNERRINNDTRNPR